jgi:hypothetical protein
MTTVRIRTRVSVPGSHPIRPCQCKSGPRKRVIGRSGRPSRRLEPPTRKLEDVHTGQRTYELPAGHNGALQKARVLTEKLEALDRSLPAVPIPDRAVLVSLAHDLPSVWHAPAIDMRLKQRIVHRNNTPTSLLRYPQFKRPWMVSAISSASSSAAAVLQAWISSSPFARHGCIAFGRRGEMDFAYRLAVSRMRGLSVSP